MDTGVAWSTYPEQRWYPAGSMEWIIVQITAKPGNGSAGKVSMFAALHVLAAQYSLQEAMVKLQNLFGNDFDPKLTGSSLFPAH